MTNAFHVNKDEILKVSEHDIREEMERVFKNKDSMMVFTTNKEEESTAYHGHNISTNETAMMVTHLLLERKDIQMLVLTNLMIHSGGLK